MYYCTIYSVKLLTKCIIFVNLKWLIYPILRTLFKPFRPKMMYRSSWYQRPQKRLESGLNHFTKNQNCALLIFFPTDVVYFLFLFSLLLPQAFRCVTTGFNCFMTLKACLSRFIFSGFYCYHSEEKSLPAYMDLQ